MYKIVVRKPAGRRPLGRSMCMREDNIKIDFEENGNECVLDSNGSQKGPVAGCLHGNEPGYMKGGEYIGQLSEC